MQDRSQTVALRLRRRHSERHELRRRKQGTGNADCGSIAAPIPFIILLVLLAAIIWRTCRWYYDRQISDLQGRLLFKEDEIKALKEKLADLNAAGSKPSESINNELAEARDDKRTSERQLALERMVKALEEAQIEISKSQGRFSNRNVPALRASILTAEKLFGIAPPYPAPENHGGPLTLWAGVNLLREVLPLLEDGHIEEARKISKAMYDAEAIRFRGQGSG